MEDKSLNYNEILKKIYKKRIVFNQEYLKIYNNHYKSNRGSQEFANKITKKFEI